MARGSGGLHKYTVQEALNVISSIAQMYYIRLVWDIICVKTTMAFANYSKQRKMKISKKKLVKKLERIKKSR